MTQDDRNQGMVPGEGAKLSRLPIWGIAILSVVMAEGIAVLLLVEDVFPLLPKTIVAWAILIAIGIPAYLIVEMLLEVCAEGLRDDGRLLIRMIPWCLVLVGYVLWFALR